jgi:hypothetical protein
MGGTAITDTDGTVGTGIIKTSVFDSFITPRPGYPGLSLFARRTKV